MNDKNSQTRRVIFVNRFYRPDLSATSQMLTDLAEGFARGSYEVRVICSRQLYDDSSAHLPPEEVLNGVSIVRVATTRFGRRNLIGRAFDYLSFYWTAFAALTKQARRGDIVVVKTDPPLISVVGMLVAKMRGAVLINWIQDLFPEVAIELGSPKVPRWLQRWLIALRDRSVAQAACNVVIGERMRSLTLQRGMSPESVAVIENWSEEFPAIPSARTQLRKQLQLNNKFVIAYSGNLGRAHEFQTILDAARLLRERPEIEFLMIGGGAGMERLRAEARRESLGNMRFLGYQERHLLGDSLATADVHLVCLLPNMEGLIVPSKIYGILAAGRPSIFIGDLSGELADLIVKHDIGFAVSIGDAQSLVAAIRRYATDPESLRAAGERARALYLERFSFGIALSKWHAVLSHCIDAAADAKGGAGLDGRAISTT